MPQGIGTYGSKRGRPPEKKAGGGSFKAVPAGNTGLAKLPTEVRNKMGYMAYGGKVKKMKHGGGTCRGLGKAKRGGKYSRSG